MNDDLVKRLTIRLQEIYDRPHDFSNGQKSEAAGLARDRIEELEAKLSESEALLAKAVEMISEMPILATYEDHVQWTKAASAELTGGKDE